MKTLSRIAVLLIAAVAIAVGLQSNDAAGADQAAKQTEKTEAFSPTSAYIRVSNAKISNQAMLEGLTKTHAQMALSQTVLLGSITADKTENGARLDRIKKTSLFADTPGETVKNLRRNLQVSAVPGTNLIRVSMDWTNPSERCSIINAVSDAIVRTASQRHLNKFNAQVKVSVAARDELNARIAARKKIIEQISGASSFAIMNTRNAALGNSLTTLTNALTSLRLDKARAEAAMENFQEKREKGKLGDSLEIQSAVDNDPEVAALRAAILQAKISALGDPDNKKLKTILNELGKMLAAETKTALTKAIARKTQELQTEITTISEKLLSVGSQYVEAAATLRDQLNTLAKIESLQSDINRLKQQVDQVNARMLRLRIEKGDVPLSTITYAGEQ